VIVDAVEGKADFIVTGDDDLLSLRAYRKIRMLSPDQFVKML
jgi:predicted nucleic acid-binding protein